MRGVVSDCEKEFIKAIISKGLRVDDRQLLGSRQLTFEFMKDYGTVLVSLGSTRVLASSYCTVAKPSNKKPSQGLIRIKTNISPMAAPYFETGRFGEFFNELRHHLDKSIKESNAVDLEALCIISGQKVWCINLNLSILNHDGNVMGCCNLAAITSLMCCRRNDTDMQDDCVLVKTFSERQAIPISLVHQPYCITFGLFERGKYVIIDPTFMEEQAMDGQVVVTITSFHEISAVHSSGQIDIDKDTIKALIHIAAKSAIELKKHVNKAIELEKAAPRTSAIICTYTTPSAITSSFEDIQPANFNVSVPNVDANMESEMKSQNEKKSWETSDDHLRKATVNINRLHLVEEQMEDATDEETLSYHLKPGHTESI